MQYVTFLIVKVFAIVTYPLHVLFMFYSCSETVLWSLMTFDGLVGVGRGMGFTGMCLDPHWL